MDSATFAKLDVIIRDADEVLDFEELTFQEFSDLVDAAKQFRNAFLYSLIDAHHHRRTK